jgi:plasmid replication initiation protein
MASPAPTDELLLSEQPTRESLVWQRNQLAEARYKLSPREQKLLLYVIAMIEPEALDFGKCKVSVRDFAEITGLKPDDLYQELRDAALAIREKTLVVENVLEPGMRKPVRRHGSWFEYVDEAIGDGYVTVKLSSWLKPLLIHVRSEFFRYRLGFALNLKSEYSIRLYQWLKRWQFLKKKTQTVAQLRLELGATEVDSEGNIVRENLAAYKHFKNKAIVPAVNEINKKTDLAVTFKEEKVKGSKAVAAVTFFIEENLASKAKLRPIALPEKPQMEFNIPSAEELAPAPEDPVSALAREFGLSRSQEQSVRVHLAGRGLAYLEEKAAVVRSQPRENLGRAFMAALKGDWQMPKSTLARKAKAPKVEPDGWCQWVKEKYPGADAPASWFELCNLFPSVRDEFLTERARGQRE